MPEEILCYIFKVNNTLIDDSDPFRKDLRDSSPMPEEILCYMFKVISTLLVNNEGIMRALVILRKAYHNEKLLKIIFFKKN